MSREEAEYLVERIKNGIGSSSATLRDCAKESLDKLVEMATLPTRYTPREEVKTGYYFARYGDAGRMPIEVRMMVSGCLVVFFCGNECDEPLEDFDDFLPVPAWLVEGVGKQPK